MRRTLPYIVLAIILAGCSGDTKTVYVYPDGENDISGAEADSSHPEYDADSVFTPDNSDDDHFVQDNGEFDSSEQDQFVTLDQDAEGQIDPDQEEDFSVDPDQQTDADQIVDPDQLIDTDVSDADQNITDEINSDQLISDEDVMDDDIDIPNQKNVHINTWPEGADTYIDEEFVGVTPFDRIMEFGSYEFTFSKSNYQTYVDTYEVNENTETIYAILQETLMVAVTFISDPDEVDVCIDTDFCDSDYLTEFTYEFYPNTDHYVYSRKPGYIDDSIDFHVGTEPMEVVIVLAPVNFDTYCGWIAGTHEYIGGEVPPSNTVSTTVEIHDDHCMVCGLEPPAPEGVCLKGEYDSQSDILALSCPDPDFCLFIVCITYPDMGIINCTYEGSEGFNVNIQWHKVN